MELLFWFFYSILAVFIGSFINVAAIRIPKQESIISPGSHCPNCKHSLKILDLIPVLSYVGLKGKCRYCHTRISPIYVLGELLTLLIFILIPITFGFSKELLIAYPFSMIMLTVTLSDIRYHIIPNKLVYPGIILLLFLRLFIHSLPYWNYLLGSIIFGGVLFLIAIISKGGMGGGDIKLFFLIGLALGWQNTLLALLLSSLAGTIIGGALLLIGKIKRKQLIPFGPFIFIGTMIAYFYGNELWHWYLF